MEQTHVDDRAVDITDDRIEIISGPEILNRVPESKLRRFIEVITEHVYDAPQIRMQAMRMRIRESIESVLNLDAMPLLQSALGGTLDVIHPQPTKEQEADARYELLMQTIASGDSYILLVDGEPASMASTMKYHFKMKDGRDAHTIIQGVTLPEFEGKHLSKRITKIAFDNIRTKFPNSPVISTTKNEKVKSKYRRLGWEEMDIDGRIERFCLLEKLRADGVPEEEIQERIEQARREAYSTFVFDPQKG